MQLIALTKKKDFNQVHLSIFLIESIKTSMNSFFNIIAAITVLDRLSDCSSKEEVSVSIFLMSLDKLRVSAFVGFLFSCPSS